MQFGVLAWNLLHLRILQVVLVNPISMMEHHIGWFLPGQWIARELLLRCCNLLTGLWVYQMSISLGVSNKVRILALKVEVHLTYREDEIRPVQLVVAHQLSVQSRIILL